MNILLQSSIFTFTSSFTDMGGVFVKSHIRETSNDLTLCNARKIFATINKLGL